MTDNKYSDTPTAEILDRLHTLRRKVYMNRDADMLRDRRAWNATAAKLEEELTRRGVEVPVFEPSARLVELFRTRPHNVYPH